MSEIPPDFAKNKMFYGIKPITPKDQEYFKKNVSEVERSGEEDDIFFIRRLYLKKYTMYSDYYHRTRYSSFDKKYKFPVHELSIIYSNLEEVIRLPKELFSLCIQGSAPLFSFPVNIVPKNIVSISFKSCTFPWNGQNLRSLKILKKIHTDNESVVRLPKFPKNIEHIVIQNSGLSLNYPKSLNGFKISDYPKLKFLLITGLRKEQIPQEWKDAKKEKKLTVIYKTSKFYS